MLTFIAPKIVNTRLRLRSGQSYASRQFLINGLLSKVEGDAKQWVDETANDLLEIGDFVGRSLVMYPVDNSVYGIAAATERGGETTTCSRGVVRCIGSSVPEKGMKAYFSITCGNRTYLGPDRYFFSPRNEIDVPSPESPIRSYACNGLDHSVRPEWRLMSYYPADDECKSLINATYDSSFCVSATYFLLNDHPLC